MFKIPAPTYHHAETQTIRDAADPDAYFFDIDAEQLRARYDPRQLSANVAGIPASASNEDATSCQTADGRYGHGQKVIFLGRRLLLLIKCYYIKYVDYKSMSNGNNPRYHKDHKYVELVKTPT